MMQRSTPEESILFDAWSELRGSMDSFHGAVTTGICVLLHQLESALDVYPGLMLLDDLPTSLHEANRSASPDTIGKVLKRLEKTTPQYFLGLMGLINFDQFPDFDVEALRACSRKIAQLDLSARRPLAQLRLGELVERLWRHSAMSSRAFSSDFSSAPALRLMAQIAAVQERHSVHDPTCGAGGNLTATARYLAECGGDPSTLYLTGQDRSGQQLALCRLNLLLHGLHKFDLREGDILDEPGFLTGEKPQLFDRVLSAPPWGAARQQRLRDRFHRFTYGEPPARRADTAFLQHALSATEPGGLTVLHLPSGVLFRDGAEKQIRQNLVVSGHLRAVVSLPSHITPYVNLPSALLVLKPEAHQEPSHPILLVDARSMDFSWRDEDLRTLAPHLDRIVLALHTRQPEPGFAIRPSIRELEGHDYNLLPHIYMQPTSAEKPDVAALTDCVRRYEEEVGMARERLDSSLAEVRRISANTRPRL
jgi:type I restriction enzyme M protein